MTQIIPSPQNIKDYLIPQLKDSGWYSKLRLFVNGESFDKILQTLLDEYALGYRFTPRVKDLFRCFQECPFEKTKVVWYCEELSPYIGRHTGLAYDCSGRNRADNALKAIHLELQDTIPGSKPSNSLQHWAEQGVLLLTSELTTTIDVKRAHVDLYKSWNNLLFDVFKHDLRGAVFVFIGKGVWDRAESLHKESVVLKTDVPNEFFPQPWGSDIFRKVNHELIKKGKEPINW